MDEKTKVTLTNRGFERIDFIDLYNEKCSLQQSSVIGDYENAFDRPGSSAVWLGCDENDKRMHLNREQISELVHHLQNWLETGSFQDQEPNMVKERKMTEDELIKAQEEYIKEATRITEEYRKGMNEIKTKYGIP